MIKCNVVDEGLRKSIHDHLISCCLDGECYAFAMAMHRSLDWPMIGLMQDKIIRHAAVVDPKGNLFDARGFVKKEEFGKPFGINFPYETKTITEGQLIKIAPMLSEYDIAIDSLSRKAQVVWPDLPWKPDTISMRMKAFALELENLSRKHGLWIYGNFPTSLPAIAEGDGEEKGYALEAVIGGYVINRSFDQ